MDLTPKQQTSEAIRQAETILITTGQHPSIDQISAVIGLSMILTKFGKKVSPVMSDSLPQSVQLLETAMVERGLSGMRDFVLKLDVSKAEVDKLRYEVLDNKLQIFITPFKGGFAPSDVTFDYGASHYDLAIILGVPTRARIDRVYEQNMSTFELMPMINLDFHRSNENYGAVNLIEPNASSLCEMLVALAESLQGGIIDAEIATALLMGIVGSTDRFTASHTTSKSLTVAAQMMAAGAKQQAVVKALYRDGRGDARGDQPRSERAGGGERGAGRERGEREGRDNNALSSRDGASRERDGQRTARPAQASSQPQPQPQPHPQPQPQPQPQAQAPSQPSAPVLTQSSPAQMQPEGPVQRELEPQIRFERAEAVSSPVAAVAAPISEAGQFEASESDLPIIQPSHIELSQMEPVAQPEAVQPAVASSVAAAPVEHPAAPAPLPMADFASAAERLVPQPVAEANPQPVPGAGEHQPS